MSLQVAEIATLTSRLPQAQDVDGFSVGDEKSVTLTNTSLNVENSTVHIGNVIHHHVHVPVTHIESQDDSGAQSDDGCPPEKTDITRHQTANKYELLTSKRKLSIILTLLFVAVLVAGSFLLVNFINTPKEKISDGGDEDGDSDPKPSISFGNVEKLGDCKIFEEEYWGLKRNLGDIILKHPVPLIIISHSVTPFCNTTKSCKANVKQMQEYHISKGYADIGYNFVVGGDASIYVGRGWNARNTHLGNHSIGINFIGNYFRDELTPEMIHCVKAIMDYGVKAKILEDDYKIVCHNQTNSATSSPGPNVYAEVKKWPHFMAGEVSRGYLYGE